MMGNSFSLLSFLEFDPTSAIVTRIGWLLVHSLWQFGLIALIAGLFSWLMRGRTAAARYGVLSSALLLIVIAPVVTGFCLQWDKIQASEAIRADSLTNNSPLVSNDLISGFEPTFPVDIESLTVDRGALRRNDSDANSIAGQSYASGTQAELWWNAFGEVLRPWLSTIVAVWCFGVLLFSIRPVWGWLTVQKLKRVGTSPAVSDVQQALQRMIARLQPRQRVEVLASTLVTAPVVVGCLRSVILLPASFISTIPMSQLEAILAHELAHARRYDYLVNLLQTLVETVFFYHPAVWWLSHRIRIEREDCCDDLVVAALGNRVEYGRALLAVQEYRGAGSTLALSAQGGSLLARVRRLFAPTAEMDQRASAGIAAASLLVACGFAAMIWSTVWAGDPSNKGFGQTSNGLQARLVALRPGVQNDSPDFGAAQSNYLHSDDMTFGIELKNVSDRELTLAGIRYGEGYAKQVQGTLRAEMLAPHWFEFEFSDSEGKPSRRAHREFYHQWHVCYNSSTHQLAPGQSLIEVLRPAKFHAPMDHDLPPGKYKVRVRYRGPTDELRENVRKHWPDKPILNAWQHEVVSNTVEFEVQQPSQRTKPEELIWGKPVDGLQAALEYRVADKVVGNPRSAPGVPVGTPISVVFHLKNVSDKGITFISETSRQGDIVHVTNERGEKIDVKDVFFSGEPIDVAWRLEPGEIAQLSLLTPSLNTIDQPGQYNVRYTIRFNSRIQEDDAGKVIFPRPGDYDKELDTGKTPLLLTAPQAPVSPMATKTLADSLNVMAVGFDADNRLWSIAARKAVAARRWNVETEEKLHDIELKTDRHANQYLSGELQLSPDRTRAMAIGDGKVVVWDVTSGLVVATFEPPVGQVAHRGLSCSADFSRIACGLMQQGGRFLSDALAVVWDAKSGEIVQSVTHLGSVQIHCTALSSDGSRLATGSQESGWCLWEVMSGDLQQQNRNPNEGRKHPDSEVTLSGASQVVSICFSPDNQQLAIADLLGVKLFESDSGMRLQDLEHPFRFGKCGLVFSANGGLLARVGTDKTIPIWNTQSGKHVAELPSESHRGSFSQDGKWFAAGFSDQSRGIRIWELVSNRIAADTTR